MSKLTSLFLVIGLILAFSEQYKASPISKLNLVKITYPKPGYRLLYVTANNLLSAPPMSSVNMSYFKSSCKCFQNLRTKLWSLQLPVILWNKKYMDNLRESLVKMNKLDVDKKKVQSMLIPPSNFQYFRLTWRRTDNVYDYDIEIDNTWYSTRASYVLQSMHLFILQFPKQSINENNTAVISNKEVCNKYREKLIKEKGQLQEFRLEFVRDSVSNGIEYTVPNYNITIGDIRQSKMYQDAQCSKKMDKNCYVTQKYAKEWAYDVSSKKLTKVGLYHMNIHTQIFHQVYKYLCATETSISKVLSMSIKNLNNIVKIVCKLPKYVFAEVEWKCHSYYKSRCSYKTISLGKNVAVKMNKFKQRQLEYDLKLILDSI